MVVNLRMRPHSVCGMVKRCMNATTRMRTHTRCNWYAFVYAISVVVKICLIIISLMRPTDMCKMLKYCIAASSRPRPLDVSIGKLCMAVRKFLRPHKVYIMDKNLHPHRACSSRSFYHWRNIARSNLLRPYDVCSMVRNCMAVSSLLRPYKFAIGTLSSSQYPQC